uniref:IS1634 family transposase n=1 Tax=Paradesulfitobacterium ferrireducens TaxID=2816476 RepID=UPI001A8E0921
QLDEETYKDKCFFKERWIKENGLEQKLIVTYSIKYKNYQRQIRNSQIERAQKLLNSNPTKISKSNQNDYKRFIKKTSCTSDGEIADKELYALNNETIIAEEAYDGFYAVCTNLEGSAQEIIRINQRRWEIEECFRIMKSEFKARPVYLSREDRIKAHFTTCFMSLIIYRLLEKKLGNKFTCSEIINGLREMNFYEIKGEGYLPTYTRTDFTDALHETFGFRTDYEIIKKTQMKKFLNTAKK